MIHLAFVVDDAVDGDEDLDALLVRVRADWCQADDAFDVAVWSGQQLAAVVHFRPGIRPTTVRMSCEPLALPLAVTALLGEVAR